MRESAFYQCENKGPIQLSGNLTTDQHLSFRYIDNTNTLLQESENINLMYFALTSNTGFLATWLKYV